MSLGGEHFWQAILDTTPETFLAMLAGDPSFAAQSVFPKDEYQPGIVHWVYRGDTPLHLAAAGYRVEIARALLAAGADPGACGNRRKSQPLHYAADGHHDSPGWNPERQVETLRLLRDAEALLDCQDSNGATPLHRAVRTRCSDAVRFLLAEGADPTIRNHSGSSAFHLAVQNTGRGGSGLPAARVAREEIIRLFLSHGVSVEMKDGKGTTVREAARGCFIR